MSKRSVFEKPHQWSFKNDRVEKAAAAGWKLAKFDHPHVDGFTAMVLPGSKVNHGK